VQWVIDKFKILNIYPAPSGGIFYQLSGDFQVTEKKTVSAIDSLISARPKYYFPKISGDLRDRRYLTCIAENFLPNGQYFTVDFLSFYPKLSSSNIEASLPVYRYELSLWNTELVKLDSFDCSKISNGFTALYHEEPRNWGMALSEKHILLKNFQRITPHNYIYIINIETRSVLEHTVEIPFKEPHSSIGKTTYIASLANNRFSLLIKHIFLLFEYNEEKIQRIREIPLGEERTIKSFVISLDEKYIVTLEQKNIIIRWDISTGKKIDSFAVDTPRNSEELQSLIRLNNGDIAYHGSSTCGIIGYSPSIQKIRKEILTEKTPLSRDIVNIVSDYAMEEGRSISSFRQR
jgi:hypothetical protein